LHANGDSIIIFKILNIFLFLINFLMFLDYFNVLILKIKF
jgi:hypothetical protein